MKKSRSKDYIINYDASYAVKYEDKENRRPLATHNLHPSPGLHRMSDPVLNKQRLQARLPPRRSCPSPADAADRSERVVGRLDSRAQRLTSDSPQHHLKKVDHLPASSKLFDRRSSNLKASKDHSASIDKSRLKADCSVDSKQTLSLSDLNIEREIGKGSYAVVKLASHKSRNEKYAVKIYEKSKLLDPLKKKSVDREISILQKIRHQSIIKYVTHIDSK